MNRRRAVALRLFAACAIIVAKQTGGWFMKADDIAGLSAKQIKDKFALEYPPQYICDVEIPAGTNIRVSIANRIPEWGNGGGIQYDLLGQYLDDAFFMNEKTIK